MPKALTLPQARPIIGKLVHPNRFEIHQKNGLCAVYVNAEPQAKAFGEDWETVLEELTRQKFLTENKA